MTNYEAIKNMCIDEMAEFIAITQLNEGLDQNIPEDFQTVENITKLQKEWLESEAE